MQMLGFDVIWPEATLSIDHCGKYGVVGEVRNDEMRFKTRVKRVFGVHCSPRKTR